MASIQRRSQSADIHVVRSIPQPQEGGATPFPVRYHSSRGSQGTSFAEQRVEQLIRQAYTIDFPFSYRFTKRAFDFAISGILIVLLLPLFLALAILIALDSPGPVFFFQERIGHLGRPFRMIKFRTMAHGSTLDLSGITHKHRDDARVTKVGKFLRRASLDELPQLINVIRGEMSLVGPRPEIAAVVRQYYEPWQFQRFLVPQGITGWWQITGRGEKLLRQSTDDDLHYIASASFWFDIVILYKTVSAVVQHVGAF